MKVAKIEKELKIQTESRPLKRKDAETGRQLYEWKVSLLILGEDGKNHTYIPFIKKVEFILHKTFFEPRRVLNKSPFVLEEKGWGSFDLGVTVWYKDPTVPPFLLVHDLNFDRPSYTIPYTMRFLNAPISFIKLLIEDVNEDAPLSRALVGKGQMGGLRIPGTKVSKRSLPDQQRKQSLPCLSSEEIEPLDSYTEHEPQGSTLKKKSTESTSKQDKGSEQDNAASTHKSNLESQKPKVTLSSLARKLKINFSK